MWYVVDYKINCEAASRFQRSLKCTPNVKIFGSWTWRGRQQMQDVSRRKRETISTVSLSTYNYSVQSRCYDVVAGAVRYLTTHGCCRT